MYTIDEVARRTQVSVHTLRYYEKVGILPPVSRNRANHRRYEDSDLGWVNFVQMLKATGMGLEDIQSFVRAEQQGPAGIEVKLAILRKHKALMDTKMSELQAFAEKLDHKIAYYGGQPK